MLLTIFLVACKGGQTTTPTPVATNSPETLAQVANLEPEEVSREESKFYTMTILEIGHFAQEILFLDGYIWVLRPGELIKIAPEAPYEKESFTLLPSTFHMTVNEKFFWILATNHSKMDELVQFEYETGQVVGQYPLGQSLASITHSANTIWISDFINKGIVQFATTSGSVLNDIELDFASQKISFADGKVWVLDTMDSAVSVYDATTGDQLARYPTGQSPLDIAFDDEKAWIISIDEDLITLIPFTLPDSPTTYQPSCAPKPNCYFSSIEIDKLGVMVSSALNNQVYKLDPVTGTTLTEYETRSPIDMAFDGTHLWIINGDYSRNDLGHTITKLLP